jgi:hypothetical protein
MPITLMKLALVLKGKANNKLLDIYRRTDCHCKKSRPHHDKVFNMLTSGNASLKNSGRIFCPRIKVTRFHFSKNKISSKFALAGFQNWNSLPFSSLSKNASFNSQEAPLETKFACGNTTTDGNYQYSGSDHW